MVKRHVMVAGVTFMSDLKISPDVLAPSEPSCTFVPVKFDVPTGVKVVQLHGLGFEQPWKHSEKIVGGRHNPGELRRCRVWEQWGGRQLRPLKTPMAEWYQTP